MNCKPLSEGEVKKLCDKVSRGDVPVVLYQATCEKKGRYKKERQKGDGHCDDPNIQRKGRGRVKRERLVCRTNTSIRHYNWPFEMHLLESVYIAFRAGSGRHCGRHQQRTKPRTQTTPTFLDAPPHHTSSVSIDRRFESSSLRGNISEASHISRCSSLLRDPGNRLGG